LLNIGLRGARHAADGIAVDRRVAPAEDGEAFLADDALQDAFTGQALMRLHGQERHADAIFAFGGQAEAERGALAGEELVRDLNEDAGAVAGFGIAAAGAAVRQVDEDLDALRDDVVGFVALDAGDEANAAGVVFVAGMVQALRRWQLTGDTRGFGHIFPWNAQCSRPFSITQYGVENYAVLAMIIVIENCSIPIYNVAK
jgi:hypothetical protein